MTTRHGLISVVLSATALAAEPAPAELPKLYEVGEPASDARSFIDAKGAVVIPAKGGTPTSVVQPRMIQLGVQVKF